MRICFISDTHSKHRAIDVPDADILVHCGDYTFAGTIPEVNDFLLWFSKLPHNHKIFVNGNHEVGFYRNIPLYRQLIPKSIIYLENEEVNVEGLKFYGSPYTKEFGSWAYMYYTDEEAKTLWDAIPDDTDILVTHQPPYKIHDGAPYMQGREGLFVPCLDEEGDPAGCKVLRERVRIVKPKVHSFGHIHEGSNYSVIEDTVFINAAVCDGKYKPTNPITVVTLDNNKQVIKVERE